MRTVNISETDTEEKFLQQADERMAPKKNPKKQK